MAGRHFLSVADGFVSFAVTAKIFSLFGSLLFGRKFIGCNSSSFFMDAARVWGIVKI